MSQPAQSKSHGSYDVGDFDMYLLAQTWAAQFCCVKAERCTTVPWAFSAHHLSLHGLWPGFYSPRGSETYPAECATKAKLLTDQLPREYIDMAPAFTKWNVEKHYAEVGSLAKHEWKKHGTCSGLTPEGYFNEALRAMKALPGDRGTPAVITKGIGKTVVASELRDAYEKRVAITTDKKCNLAEITTCWAKDADGKVGQQVDCPAHVLRGRDSHCSNVVITQFGQCMLKK